MNAQGFQEGDAVMLMYRGRRVIGFVWRTTPSSIDIIECNLAIIKNVATRTRRIQVIPNEVVDFLMSNDAETILSAAIAFNEFN